MKEIDDIIAKLEKIETGEYFIEISDEYNSRIFSQKKDANGGTLETPLVKTGELRRKTEIKKDGVKTLDYALYNEERLGVDIFSLSDKELELIENNIINEIEKL